MADSIARTLAVALSGGGSGTSNYNDLSNKPKINNVTLQGNKSLEDLGIETLTAGEGIVIEDNEISIDTETVASKEDVQDVADDLADVEQDVSELSTAVAGKSSVSGTDDGTNWTSLTVDGTTHSIPQGGGGSVDIDGKTIVENEDGELETAIGGYKEVTSVTGVALNCRSDDFDTTYDSEIIDEIYNTIAAKGEGSVYPVTFSSDTEGIILHPEWRYEWHVDHITSTKIGYGNALYVYTDPEVSSPQYTCELYISKENNNIHIWDGSGQVFKRIPDAKLIFQIDDFEPAYETVEVVIYHRINGNYVNIDDSLIAKGNGKLGINVDMDNGAFMGNLVSYIDDGGIRKYYINGVNAWTVTDDYVYYNDNIRLNPDQFESYQQNYDRWIRYKGTVLYTQYDAEEETLNISTTPFEEE